jgi:hypothetical protein
MTSYERYEQKVGTTQPRPSSNGLKRPLLRKSGGLGSLGLNRLTQAALSSRYQSPRSSTRHPAETLQVCGLRAHPLYGDYEVIWRDLSIGPLPPFQCQNCFAKKKPWTGQEMEFIVVLFFGIVIPSGWVEGINLPASQTACERLTASIPTDARYREHLHCIVKVDGNANYSL